MNNLGIDLPSEFSQPQVISAADQELRELVQTALDHPLDYPPLREAVFPGDQVAVAVHPDVPCGEQVTQAVLDYLLEMGLDIGDITLVVAKRMNYASPNHPLSLKLMRHDHEDEESVAYLAANVEGDPIKINRELFDADVIVPITCRDNRQLQNDLYPEFSTHATQLRFKAASQKQAEVRLTNEYLGVFTSLNVVGGPGGEIRGATFGEKEKSDQMAERLAEQIWSLVPQAAVPLVIATIEEVSGQQTWAHFCRALVAANDVSDGDGQIVVCSGLETAPDDDYRQAFTLPFEGDEEAIWKKLGGMDEILQRVVPILMDRQVFLKSNLPDSVIEELGIGPISSQTEFDRLIERAQDGIILRDAHKVSVGRS